MRICGQDVEVVIADPTDWAPNAMGRSLGISGKIMIRQGMPKTVQHSTFVHELLHYIAMANDLAELDDKEAIISTIANSLLAWMQDNPTVVMELAGMKPDKSFLS